MRVSPQCTHAKFLSLQTASAFFLLHFLYLLHFLPHGLPSRAFFHFLVQQVYQRAGRPASDVDSELVAQYVEKSLLTDEAAIRDICVSQPTAARRILNWLDGILAKMGSQKAQERAPGSRSWTGSRVSGTTGKLRMRGGVAGGVSNFVSKNFCKIAYFCLYFTEYW